MRLADRFLGIGAEDHIGAQVTLLGSAVAPALTDELGSFELAEVPAGLYTLQAERSGFRTVRVGVAVRGGEDTDLGEILLEPQAGLITGTVTLQGRAQVGG